MSTSARVDSIDSIKEFRAYLAKFQEMAGRALGDAESDINRWQTRLEGELLNHWSNQIRKRQEILVKAEEALRYKKLFKDSTGSTPSAVEELKAVAIAKKNLADAQQKLANVKQWARKLQRQIIIYKGAVAAFTNAVFAGVPHAVAQLGGTIEMLEKYTGLAPATVGEDLETTAAGVGAGEQGGPSMARAADEAEAGESIDPAALRAMAPTAQAVAAAEALPAGPVKLACATLTEQQQEAIASLGAERPGDEDLIVVAPTALAGSRIYLLRAAGERSAWRVGSIDGAAESTYNSARIGDFLAGRPDLANVLKLPANFLVVIDPGGICAVYDPNDQNVLPSPAAPAVAGSESA